MGAIDPVVYSILSHASSRIGLAQTVVLAAASFVIGATSVLSQTPAAQPSPATPTKGKRWADMKGAFIPARAAKPDLTPSLYKRSIILFDGEEHTVVPLGSVLRLPAGYRSRIIDEPKGTFLFWTSFAEKNKSWVGGWEVSMAMARGDKELAKKVMQQTAQDPRVLVAVLKGGPITVLEPVPDKTSGGKE
jgi:hypothetical protein